MRDSTHIDLGPLGISVRDLDAGTTRRLGIPDIYGVLISDVDAAGPARLAGVRLGQVLLEINRHQVTSTSQYRAAVAALRPGEPAAVLVYDPRSDQRAIYVVSLDPRQTP